MEELMEILEEIRPDVDFEEEQFLVDNGILNSIDIIMLIGALNDAYDIEVQPMDLIPENFNNVKAILALVERLQNE